jgi:hypothetical protein
MSLCPPRGLLALFVLWLWLPAPALAVGGVKDGAALFKASTRDRAEDEIDEIHRRTHKDLFIETINKLSPEELRQYRDKATDAERAGFFHDLAEKRARAEGVDGVYVLLCRVPAAEEPRKGFFHFIPQKFTELFPPQVVGHAVIVWPPSNDAYFPQDARARLDGMFTGIRTADHNQDQVLLAAVNSAGDELEANARALGAPPADTFRWTDIVGAAAALAAAWFILGVARARLAARQGTAAPAPGADQALAALYGTAAALWLFEAYHARRQAAAAPPPVTGPAPEADDIPPDGPAMHPDDLEALARGPAPWASEDTEATTGHDRP